MTPPANVLLLGVVGSTAHGLAAAHSDRDMAGVFAHPTEALFAFDRPADSVVTHDPDSALHEIEKFLRLALTSSPAALELLWLDDYDVLTESGRELLGIRDSFLGTDTVRDAYLGYAKGQWKRVCSRTATEERGDVDLDRRLQKGIRHTIRLLEQAYVLLSTGRLAVAVADRNFYLDELPALADDRLHDLVRERLDRVASVPSVLPDAPDREAAERLLRGIRYRFLRPDARGAAGRR
jgi:predicted nucleotidyltransferase